MKVKTLYQWFSILVICLPLVLAMGCGRGKHDASDALQVDLALPEGVQSEVFWFGVERKVLRVEKQGKSPKELPWNSNQTLELDLDADDRLIFQGYDSESRIVVLGDAKVGKDKNIMIPLRRVL